MKRRYKLGFIARPREQKNEFDNIVKNGGFDDESFWTIEGLSTISDGKANIIKASTDPYTAITQNLSGTIGKTYSYSFDAVVDSGVILLYLGDQDSVWVDSSGTKTGTITNTSAVDKLILTAYYQGDNYGTFDNVSLIEQ